MPREKCGVCGGPICPHCGHTLPKPKFTTLEEAQQPHWIRPEHRESIGQTWVHRDRERNSA